MLPDVDNKFDYENSTDDFRTVYYTFYSKNLLFHNFYRTPYSLI